MEGLPLVASLLESDSVSTATAAALKNRLEFKRKVPGFFDENLFMILVEVSNLLVAQHDKDNEINIAAFIDDRLSRSIGNGWRYSSMPPDGEMYVRGLKGIDETSVLQYQKAFVSLGFDQQVSVLKVVQSGKAPGSVWKEMSPMVFFEELLAEVTEVFYAHPLAQVEINYIGMADKNGWKDIGLKQEISPQQDKIKNEALRK